MTSTGSSSSTPAEAAAVDRADLVIGLATYNSASLLDGATDALRWAASGGLGELTTRVVLADGGSTDGTPDRVRALVDPAQVITVEYPVQASDLLAQPYHAVPGRLRAVERILRQAQDTGARACVMIDLAACGAGTGWIRSLADRVLGGSVDFVGGVQTRHPHAGGLITGILRPVFGAVYGVRLRHPVADTYAISERLLQQYLGEIDAQPDGGQPPVDVRLPALAACEGLTLSETALGPRGEMRDGPDLSTALSQAVGALFSELERRPEVWQRLRRSSLLAPFETPRPEELPAPAINIERLAEAFRLGSRELRDVWALVLPPLASVELKKLADTPLARFRFDDQLWARIIYDYAIAHRLRTLARDHLLPSLVPLYLGWLASFVLETDGAAAADAEARLDRLCDVFEREKPYLISRWRWPERAK